MLALRAQKQSLSVLLQRGSVGDDLWKRFLRAEKEMEEEVKDVVAEVSTAMQKYRVFCGLLLIWLLLGKLLRPRLGPIYLPIRQ